MAHCRTFILITICLPGLVARADWWPGWSSVRQAAVETTRDPRVWVPLAGAAVIAAAGKDRDISDYAIRHQPVFGSDAERISQGLLTRSHYLFGACLGLMPARDRDDWLNRGITGIAALTGSGATQHFGKPLIHRRRPDGLNDKSFPSGHASQTAVMMDYSRRIVRESGMPAWSKGALAASAYAISVSAAWGRVEAGRHYPTDVLVGHAIGAWFSGFMYRAFRDNGALTIGYVQIDEGGVLTLQRRF